MFARAAAFLEEEARQDVSPWRIDSDPDRAREFREAADLLRKVTDEQTLDRPPSRP